MGSGCLLRISDYGRPSARADSKLSFSFELESPNGLIYNSGQLFVAAWGMGTDKKWRAKKKGSFYRIDMETKKRTIIISELGHLDGVKLRLTDKTKAIVSDWVSGKVYEVDRGKKTTRELFSIPGAADFELLRLGQQVYVLQPSMTGGFIKVHQLLQ